MKPILVLQNQSADGPAYLAHWLQRAGLAFDVFDTQRGQAYPERIDGYGALALLGGEMSANDRLPSLQQAERLVLQAFERDVPVVGHCLGGQLMAKALGARIGPSAAPEIGWQPMQVEAGSSAAHDWFGDAASHVVYHWHEEAFELPPGAVSLATSAACRHQAFAYGRHLAMQFHVELDAAKLAVWAASRDPRFLTLQERHATVQSGPSMLAQSAQMLPAQHRLADRIYERWIAFAR